MSFTRPRENIFTYLPWLLRVDRVWRSFKVEEYQSRGDRLLVKLVGIETPEQVYQYTNADIAIKREQLPDLSDGEHYWHDLIGLQVLNQEQMPLGKISEIIETGANDVLVVAGERKEKILIPFVTDVYVKQIDLETGYIQVDWQMED